jgi:hypothetical protein
MATIPMGNFGQQVARAAPAQRVLQGDPVGDAVQRVGQQAGAIAGDMARSDFDLQQKQQRAEASLALVKAQNQLHDAHDEVARGVMDGTIPADKADGEFTKAAGKVRESVLGGYQADQRATMDAHITGVEGGLQRGLQGVVFKRKQQETASTIDQFGEQVSREAMRQGPAWASQKFGAMVDFTGEAAGLNPAQQQKIKQSFTERVHAQFYEAAGVAALEKGDITALQTLREQVSGPQGEVMDPQKRIALVREIMGFERQVVADQQRKATEGRFDIASRTKDVQAMVLSGVTLPDGVAPTVEEYTKLHGASGPAMWQQEVGNYLQIGGAIQQMKVASAAEREQIARQQEPTAGAGFAGNMQIRDAVLQARKIVEAQIIADPAAYAMTNSPRAQKYAQAMQLVAGSKFSSPQAQADAMRTAVDSFAVVMNAEQLRLGVDTIRDDRTGNKLRGPKLLTSQQANAISDQFHDQSMGGAKAAVLTQALEAQWGKWWPQVYGQLANDTKLPPAALVIPNMPNDGSRARMAAASVMKMDDLKALVEPSDPKDIKEKLLSQFGNAQPTFTAQGADGNRTLAVVMGEAEKLALMYRSQGKSVGDAAKQAFTETMGHRYEFADTYRIPKTEMPKDVQAGAAFALRGIKPTEAQVFAGPTPTLLTDDALRNRSMWVTNADESGLQLMLRGADGGVYAVQDTAGKPIQYTWPALRSMATTARTPVVERQTDIEELRRRQQELNPRR